MIERNLPPLPLPPPTNDFQRSQSLSLLFSFSLGISNLSLLVSWQGPTAKNILHDFRFYAGDAAEKTGNKSNVLWWAFRQFGGFFSALPIKMTHSKKRQTGLSSSLYIRDRTVYNQLHSIKLQLLLCLWRPQQLLVPTASSRPRIAHFAPLSCEQCNGPSCFTVNVLPHTHAILYMQAKQH